MTDPRDLWHPVLGHLFGITPWQMRDLRFDELEAIRDYLEKLSG